MTITINGRPAPVPPNAKLIHVVTDVTGRALADDGHPVDGRRLGVAVALNSDVVPRSRWAGTTIADGDEVEVVAAMQGG